MAGKKRRDAETRHRALARHEFDGFKSWECMLKAGYGPQDREPTAKERGYLCTSFSNIRTTSPHFKDEAEKLRKSSRVSVVRRREDRRDEYMDRLDKVYERCMQFHPVQIKGTMVKEFCECGKPIEYTFVFDAKNALRATEMSMIEDGMQIRQTEVRHGRIEIIEGNYDEILNRMANLLFKTGPRFCRDLFAMLEERGIDVRGEPVVVAGSDSRGGNGARPADQATVELLPPPSEAS